MAYFHTIYTCALFLAVIACHETQFTEGRQLKSTKRQELSSKEDQKDIEKQGSSTNYSHQKPTVDLQVSAEGDVHSAGDSAAKETLPQQALNQSRAFRDSAKESVDDFRPTAPGSSPGVGHSFADHNVNTQPEALGKSGVDQTTDGNSNDFRPTVPGHSPGVGHSLRNKNVKLNA